jgi:hypothetical protein
MMVYTLQLILNGQLRERAYNIVQEEAAVCCSVLQCAAACCSVLQCVALCCNVLQCVALHCVAVCITHTLQLILHSQLHENVYDSAQEETAACRSVLQYIAVFCSTLQCVVVCITHTLELILHGQLCKRVYNSAQEEVIEPP